MGSSCRVLKGWESWWFCLLTVLFLVKGTLRLEHCLLALKDIILDDGMMQAKGNYSWPLNNRGMNSMSSFIHGFFFSVVNAAGIHDSSAAVESTDMVELQIQRNHGYGGATVS